MMLLLSRNLYDRRCSAKVFLFSLLSGLKFALKFTSNHKAADILETYVFSSILDWRTLVFCFNLYTVLLVCNSINANSWPSKA